MAKKGPYGATLPPDPAGTRGGRPRPAPPVVRRDRVYRRAVPEIADSEYGLDRMAREDQGPVLRIEQFGGKTIPAQAPKKGE